VSTATQVGRDPAVALAAPVRSGASGILTTTRGKLKRLFCFERGRLVYAASNLIEEQFDEYLVSNKLLTSRERAEAKIGAARAKIKFGAFLLDNPPSEGCPVTEAAEQFVLELLRSTVTAPDTQYSFSPGRPNIAGEMTVSLSVVPFVLKRVSQYPAAIHEVRVKIGPPNTRPRLTQSANGIFDGLEVPAEASYLLEASDGDHDVGQLVEESPEDANLTLRTLYGLMLLGALEAVQPTQEKGGSPKAQVTRDEVLGRLNAATGATHYALLGLEPEASREEIRDSYYMLARRYHPDRFRSGALTDLLPRMEGYFTQVTEAYNTLHDSNSRSLYDEELHSSSPSRKEPEQDAQHLARQNYLRARSLIEKGRFTDAVTFLENAIKLKEDEFDFQFELGRILALNPRHRADAETHLKRALEIDPTQTGPQLELGRLYQKTNRKTQAIQAFRAVLNWEPTNEEAKTHLGELGEAPEGRRGLFTN